MDSPFIPCPEFDGCTENYCAYPGEEACFWELSEGEREELRRRPRAVQGRYRTIVADPPWPYSGDVPLRLTKDGSRERGHRGQYAYMPVQSIKAIRPPVFADAHLYLWTTNAFMVEAHSVAQAWGFRPVTICTWVKTHHADAGRVSMKTGHYFRGATEHFIFGVRGSLRLTTSLGLPTAYLWPRAPHSVKPEAFYDLVQIASPGPYLELFARRNRLGWDTWGNEALEHVTLDVTRRPRGAEGRDE